MSKVNNTQLVLELFSPNELGQSRWVDKKELIGKWSSLYPTNGNHWYRNKGLSHLIFEKKEEGGSIQWRFNGLKSNLGTRGIRTDIWNEVRNQPCVITNLRLDGGHRIEVDHRDGRYPDRVMDLELQRVDDFQPLLESLNKQKRSDCIKCKVSGKRYDARERGCSISVSVGSLEYEGSCVGCFWFNPKEFLK